MKKINPNVIAIGWVSFFTDMASAMLVPILPIYLVSVLNQGVDKLGIVLAISSFISYFLRYIAGYLADRMGRVKIFLLLGYAISSIAKPLFCFTASWQSVAALKSIERLGKAIRTAPKDVLINHYSLTSQSGKNFGFHKMMDIAGELMGSIIIFILLYFYDFNQHPNTSHDLIKIIFLATAIPGVIAFCIALFFIKDTTSSNKLVANGLTGKGDEENIVKQSTSRLLKRQMLFFFLFSFCLMEESFFILQSQKVMAGLLMVPLLLMLNKLTQTLTSYHVGLAADRFSPNKLMPIAYLFALLAMICFAQESVILLWFGFAFLGLYTVIGLNLMRSLIAKQEYRVGHYYGLFYTGMAISVALGALFWGYLWQQLGGYIAINIALFGVSLLLIVYLLLNYFSLFFNDE